jgi:L-aminopeptidase/D-esterase-like protein
MSLSPLGPSMVPALSLAFPRVRVGNAEYSAAATEITLFHFPECVDVRGGSPGTTFTEGLSAACGKSGIALCGGSAYGLEAGCAVAAGLLRSGLASKQGWSEIALVPTAVVFNYKGRDNCAHPNRALG